MDYTLFLPDRTGTPEKEEALQTSNNIVLIGANGSGKTRLGVRIEQKISKNQIVHRISAQRALNIPDFAAVKNVKQAEMELLMGNTNVSQTILWNKMTYRWGGSPEVFLLNDFDKLLSLLFAKTTERDRKHSLQTRETHMYIPVPDSPIDIIIRIWSELMPHRNISFSDGKVVTKKEGSGDYPGKEMSDGERVILYMIGQCLCIPENSIIIIDEPEIHIHRSIVSKLWNRIEELCPNKLFIYITHDLDFASSRKDALKFWIKSYNGNNSWEWDTIPEEENLPENLLLEILGNRKDVIFCEGENGSLDTSIYELFYPDFYIVPRGGCDKVIEATKALRNNKALHYLNAFGIIDSDYKEEPERQALKENGIYTISVAEIESLFCVEPILRIMAEHLQLPPDKIVSQVKEFLVNTLKSEIDVQVSSMAEKQIAYKLGAFSKKDNSERGLIEALAETNGRIDVNAIYSQCKDIFQQAIDSRDLNKLLLIYNRKSLPDRLSSIFELEKGGYRRLLIRLLKRSNQKQIINALKDYLPELK